MAAATMPSMRSLSPLRSAAAALVVLAGCAPYGHDGAPLAVGSASHASLSAAPMWRSTELDDRSESVAVADWNDDGILDIAFAVASNDPPPAGGPNRVYEGLGDGTFALAWSSEEEEHSLGVAWADIDRDGDPDLVVVNDGAPNRLYDNRDGDFVSVWQSAEADRSFGVTVADWDSDDDLDVAVATIGGPNYIYKNLSGELVEEAAWVSPHPDDNTSAIAWGDYDLDGDPDLACANDPYQANRLYRNDDGEMVSVWTSVTQNTSNGVAWGDMNGDGYPEFAFSNEWTGFTVFENFGGEMNDGPIWIQPETDDNDIDNDHIGWGDFDLDGLDDVVVIGHQRDRVWKTVGEGVFETWWRSPNSLDGGSGVAVADFDDDGDPDIAVALTSGGGAVFENVGRDEQVLVDEDGDGVFFPEDCDDTNPEVGDADEVCNGLDDDCDGVLLPEERDLDGDGAGECQGDCDDTDPEIGVDSPECEPVGDDDDDDTTGGDDCEGCSQSGGAAPGAGLACLVALLAVVRRRRHVPPPRPLLVLPRRN